MATTTAHKCRNVLEFRHHLGTLSSCESRAKSRSPFWWSLIQPEMYAPFNAVQTCCLPRIFFGRFIPSEASPPRFARWLLKAGAERPRAAVEYSHPTLAAWHQFSD